jgi:hypothetical protein
MSLCTSPPAGFSAFFGQDSSSKWKAGPWPAHCDSQHVGWPLPQRGQAERHHLHAVIEVLSETAFFDGWFQVPVGGHDQADVGAAGLREIGKPAGLLNQEARAFEP